MKRVNVGLLGAFLGLAMVLAYVDSLVPVFPVPGFKMGLANVAVLFVLLRFGAREAFLVSMTRVFLMSLLFSNGVSAIYSFAGAFLSWSVMALLVYFDLFEVAGVSVCGAMAHHVGQILAAFVVMDSTAVFYYLPILMVLSIVSGILIGVLAVFLMKRVGRL